MSVTLEKKSVVLASAEEIWSRITQPIGINYELAPLMRMTVPKGFRGKTIRDVELGRPIGRCWLLLFGLFPFDYDDLVIAELEHGRRFRETSSMLIIRAWEHERTLRPIAEGTEVTDRLTFELRRPFSGIPFMSRLVAGIVAYVFDHRHRRLTRWFARRAAPKYEPAPPSPEAGRDKTL